MPLQLLGTAFLEEALIIQLQEITPLYRNFQFTIALKIPTNLIYLDA